MIALSGITTKVFNKSVIPSLWLFEKVTEIVDTRVREKVELVTHQSHVKLN